MLQIQDPYFDPALISPPSVLLITEPSCGFCAQPRVQLKRLAAARPNIQFIQVDASITRIEGQRYKKFPTVLCFSGEGAPDRALLNSETVEEFVDQCFNPTFHEEL